MVKTVVSLWVTCQAWWLIHAIPAFGRLRQEDCDEFKPSLSCVVSFRPARRPWVAAAALPLTCLFHARCGGGTTLGLWLQGGVVCPAFHICPKVLVPLLCWFSVLFFFFMCMDVLLVCMTVRQMCSMPKEARRELQIPRNWINKCLWAAI